MAISPMQINSFLVNQLIKTWAQQTKNETKIDKGFKILTSFNSINRSCYIFLVELRIEKNVWWTHTNN